MTPICERFINAITYAIQLHEKQLRKGTEIPYSSHLLAVASLVLEEGGDEDMAIAALLHDAVEDQGGRIVLCEIRRRYGERVAKIVEGCTDSFENPKPSWLSRKEKYLEHLLSADEDILTVSLADKLHNARSILMDLRVNGNQIWNRFNGHKIGTLWYYRSLIEIFAKRMKSPLIDELAFVMGEIERLTDK